MRNCPACDQFHRSKIWAMEYQIPDGWPLPSVITWYECNQCGMIYGDGDFNQGMLNEYYIRYYGYGVNSPANAERLKSDAGWIFNNFDKDAVIVDFGGAGDDGRSVLTEELLLRGFKDAVCTHAGSTLPNNCDLIYASHVIEHVYDVKSVMESIFFALKPDGLFIMDGPDAMGLLQRWKMPILDFNTKHINHFTLRNYLDLAHRYGFEMVDMRRYELEIAPAYQLHLKRLDVGFASKEHVEQNIRDRITKLLQIYTPVNVWGLGDITWHLLKQVNLDVADYIDNDPAFIGQTFKGKPILQRPTNDYPIVIMAQGQRHRLIENIRAMDVRNEIIEI